MRRTSPRSAWWHHWCLAAILVLSSKQLLTSCSIHEVHEKATGCKVTERMFADGHGPLGFRGHSSLEIHASLRPLNDEEVHDAITVRRLKDYFDFGVVVVSYTSEAVVAAGFHDQTACSWNFSNTSNVEGKLEGKFYAMESDQTLQVNTIFYPRESGLQTALVIPCWKQKSAAFGYPVSADEFVAYPMADPLVYIDATFGFRNSYGYLPGLLYGLFPFKRAGTNLFNDTATSGVLSLMYGALGIYFLILMNRHRQSAVGTHYFLLVVLLLATSARVFRFLESYS
ncbi:hypothetical protein PsorP6_000991 [Peronosclerospora sorghi]|uniref:Uncharacterized protein n=1 Tax=Peronosclerospora sorghi TaxID=230839 RepID=A0ACC0WTG2_9STRA|nr:hypothetical protein PsorP6_000991 [Peronosclerospora sorghi]